MLICIKPHLNNIWNSVHEKNKQHWDWAEKKRYLKTHAHERAMLIVYQDKIPTKHFPVLRSRYIINGN